MIGERELINTYLTPYDGPKNPNLYVTFATTVATGIWASTTLPWQEALPWQIP